MREMLVSSLRCERSNTTFPEPARPRDEFDDRKAQSHLHRVSDNTQKTSDEHVLTSAHGLCLCDGSDGLSGCIVVLWCSIRLIHCG